MSNLTMQYTEAMTIPESNVYEGMLLIILGHENKNIPDGTMVRVTEKLGGCNEHTLCNNDYHVNDCCRNVIYVQSADGMRLGLTSSCYCSLVTIDGRLVVANEKYRRQMAYE